LDVQLCKHGHATVLIDFLKNRFCHYGVFGWISWDNQNITNFKGQWHRKFLLAISILLDDLTMKILSFRSQTF
jgi:hypothetical protein